MSHVTIAHEVFDPADVPPHTWKRKGGPGRQPSVDWDAVAAALRDGKVVKLPSRKNNHGKWDATYARNALARRDVVVKAYHHDGMLYLREKKP